MSQPVRYWLSLKRHDIEITIPPSQRDALLFIADVVHNVTIQQIKILSFL
jgi:hypothetical protein